MSSPPSASRSERKQLIRPRFLDLAEFDDEQFRPGHGQSDATGFTHWPPAATVVRKPPPSIKSKKDAGTVAGTSSAALTASKQASVEDADESAAQHQNTQATGSHSNTSRPPRTDTTSRNVRFQLDTPGLDSEDGKKAQGVFERPPDAHKQPEGVPRPLSFPTSLIGNIQERPVGRGSARTRPGTKARTKPASKFFVARKMDEDLRKYDEEKTKERTTRDTEPTQDPPAWTPQAQAPGTGFPIVSRRDQIEPILPPISAGKDKGMSLNEDISSVPAPKIDSVATSTALSSNAKGSADNDEEEWLDEDGRPMSAFRKSRLLRQGLRPPSTRKAQSSQQGASNNDAPSFQPDPTRDPGGGADIDTITAVLADVSRENSQKLNQMSTAEIAEEVKSLESLFSKDVLDALRFRRKEQRSSVAPKSTGDSSDLASAATPKREDDAHADGDPEGPEAIKRRYFPSEPKGPNPNLEWMLPQKNAASKPTGVKELRFDFTGNLITGREQDGETYLSGLHHHGDNQNAPGYTISELMHLSRSTVAAQRQLSLNVLGRICQNYPANSEDSPALMGAEQAATAQKLVAELLNGSHYLLRASIIMIARWLLGDRNFTVRAAALRCTVYAVRSLPSGYAPVAGVMQHLDWRTLSTKDLKMPERSEADEASEAERSIQKDWAQTMLDSGIVSLFMDGTDSIVTSAWEADLALELLCRIAMCSVSHATQVFGARSGKHTLGDFAVLLGLRVAWPPSDGSAGNHTAGSFDALPSLWALRLLHVGVLCQRDIAKTIVVDGIADHLLRFVLTQPWKIVPNSTGAVDDAIELHAYETFDLVLQIYAALALYGFYATVVGRAWEAWHESGRWASATLAKFVSRASDSANPTALEQAQAVAAQRIFECFAAWTHCAKDPHHLMNLHDVDWAQIRDLIEVVPDLSLLGRTTLAAPRTRSVAPALGALCHFVEKWTDYSMHLDKEALSKHLAPCRSVLVSCQDLLRTAFQQCLADCASIATTASLGDLDELSRALRRMISLAHTLSKAESTLSSGSDIADTTQANDPVADLGLKSDVMLLIATTPIWKKLGSPSFRTSGRLVFRQELSALVASTLMSKSTARHDPLEDLLAVSRLDTAYSHRVLNVVRDQTRQLVGQEALETLDPFLSECIKGSRASKTQSGDGGQAEISLPFDQIQTLFKCDTFGRGDSKPAEDKELDPITGTELWRCPANGLPLRADWPLLPLDDLLHSANTAVFNRPDNLAADWKANELDIVQASTRLAVQIFGSLLKRFDEAIAPRRTSVASADLTPEARAILVALPSPEQILLGIMKVYMLEKDQHDTFTDTDESGQKRQKASGVLTGRDIFRDPSVSKSLTSLLDVTDRLVELRAQFSVANAGQIDVQPGIVDLEAWTAATLGSDVPFYQFFTDLVGLYDAISFGDANFARVVMTVACGPASRETNTRSDISTGIQSAALYLEPSEQGMPQDFRSLVWNDYRDSLGSMPATPCARWLLSWQDSDENMLQHYARFLATATDAVGQKRTLPYRVALHHLSAAAHRFLVQPETEETVETGGEGESQSTSSRLRALLASFLPTCSRRTLRDLIAYKAPDASLPENETDAENSNNSTSVEFLTEPDEDVINHRLDSLSRSLGLRLSL
ncbi:hypothetical protein BCV70DRAFT_196745 [Testicularia cyperi]|uniref:RNA polymerase II-associated protein 1 C-terminal domain-containing protein n=1 Tax=Testicularia cyperi TaxID=1882483 RepID=A0A317XW72_9BASI|nr:hypothetical protein BCV70DRAFT_196745 [Testicularia cyperi]